MLSKVPFRTSCASCRGTIVIFPFCGLIQTSCLRPCLKSLHPLFLRSLFNSLAFMIVEMKHLKELFVLIEQYKGSNKVTVVQIIW